MKVTKNSLYEVFRFGIVGVFATLLHYGIYWLLISYLSATIAYSIGYAISFFCNFWLTSIFTFRSKPSVLRGVGFGLAHGVNYLLHVLLLNLFLWVGIPKTLAPIPVFTIVIPVNFVLVKMGFKKLS